MKLYRIVKCGELWDALGGEPEHIIGASDDRSTVLLVARRVAARNEGEVHLCDEAGKLETIYAYRGGAELVTYLNP